MKNITALLAGALFALGISSCKGPETRIGHNAPILVLATDAGFGSYTAEILRTEGFNEFQIDSLGSARVNADYLKGFDVVILASVEVTAEQNDLLGAYVKGGGNLIAFKPDKKLNGLFGISEVLHSADEGHLSIDTDTEIGKGISGEKLRIHVPFDATRINGAKEIAVISGISKKNDEPKFPAVVLNEYGSGRAVAFLYNLPQNIVLTRQGNSKVAGKEMDGIDGIRAMDMFTDGWVDSANNVLNPADEQMRLLSHCIETLGAYSKPLPRFWYFPDSLKCLVTLTNDGEDSREVEFGPQFADVDAKGAKMVLYIKETDRVSKEWVTTWIKKGFEMGGHFDDTRQAQDPDWKTMDSVIRELKSRLNAKYGIEKIPTVVNHWFVWCGKDSLGNKDFTAQAELETANGIGMDINYAHYDNKSNQGHFLGAMGTEQGNYTGSGLPMKFAGNRGSVLNLYQHLNNVYDQQYMEHKDQKGFYEAFKGLMDRSLEKEVYSYIGVKAHNNEYFFSKIPLMGMLDYANQHKVPVWAPVRLLEFLRAKDEATFQDVQWATDKLSFTINSSLKHPNGLTCLIPFEHQGKKVSGVSANSAAHDFNVRSIKGRDYAMVTVQPGTSYRIIVDYASK